MSLATVADFELLTGTDVPADDEPRVQALLDAASAAVQGATGQTLVLERTTELVVLDYYSPSLLLDEGPVVEDLLADPAVEVVVLDPSGELVPRDHYTVLADAAALKHCDCHAWSPGCYSVTYSHGFDPVPADLVALVCGSAARVLAVPAGMAGVQAQSVGSYSVTFRDDAGVGELSMVGGSIVDRYSLGRGA